MMMSKSGSWDRNYTPHVGRRIFKYRGYEWWFGHVMKRSEEDLVRAILGSRVEGRRGRGRSNNLTREQVSLAIDGAVAENRRARKAAIR